MKSTYLPAATAVLLFAFLGGLARAGGAPLPPVQHAGPVAYLSGGIGKDEATAFEQAGPHWPLMLEFAVKDGKRADFTADVHVRVRDAHRHMVLDTTAQGPFLLARLQPGHYLVEAEQHGQTRHQRVAVTQGHAARAVFVWPAAKAAPMPGPAPHA